MTKIHSRVPWRHTRRAVGGLVVAAVLLLIASAIQAVHVHRVYGDWALWPGARTTQIPFHGRDFVRDDSAGPRAVPAGAVVLGTAPGNGKVFSSPLIAGFPPTVLYIRYPDGTVAVYELSGGP